MVIDRSVRVAAGTYRLPAPADGAAAITIRGEGITVDLTGVTLEGGDPLADPDGYGGTGILVDGGQHVTIRGGTVRGYKVGVRGRQSPGLRIAGLDASYNWKARLWSGIERESLVDWLTHHDNEQDQWLRYGAGIYLAACDGAEIEHSRVVQGQNGLMVTRSSGLRIWNNTFSWNSGLGLGLYRTTDSVIEHNRLDWDVRGYSHGFYYRGQDSAALLMYEQSSRNVVAYNSATHGGDGLFLWAGQSTMDTGQGGANDNLFWGNDFSSAVANGIEATFSRNQFIENRLDDNWHGVWGGYSYDTTFARNTFVGNTEAIAIEHGQNITIADNAFYGDGTAIRLWANATQDPNWGYPKTRDTRSHGYAIVGNHFKRHTTALDLLRTSDVTLENNTFAEVATVLKTGVNVRNLRLESGDAPALAPLPAAPPQLPGAVDAMLPAGARRGRDSIIVDQWGPYDYRSPKIWPTGRPGDRPLELRVLGPEGRWTLQSIRGGRTTERGGSVPGELTVTTDGPGTNLDLQLTYVGGEVVTPRGVRLAAGAPVPVSFALFDPDVSWRVRYWTYDEATDPVTHPDAFAARLRGAPARTDTLRHLEFVTSGPIAPALPADRVALRAESEVQLPSGTWTMDVISDDGVRVWVDDRLVIDRWSVHESVVDRAAVAGGPHRLRVEYFESTGWAELQVHFAR
jgi:nitrous oxidase accessory protein NosD